MKVTFVGIFVLHCAFLRGLSAKMSVRTEEVGSNRVDDVKRRQVTNVGMGDRYILQCVPIFY